MSAGRLAPDYRDRRDSKRGPVHILLLFDQKETAEDLRKIYAREGYRTRITARSVRADRAEAFLYVLTAREPLPPKVSEAEGSGYMLGPWATPAVREGQPLSWRPFAMRFTLTATGATVQEWVRFAPDVRHAADDAKRTLATEFPDGSATLVSVRPRCRNCVASDTHDGHDDMCCECFAIAFGTLDHEQEHSRHYRPITEVLNATL